MIDLLAAARQDMQTIATTGGFTADISLSTPDGSASASITGLSTGRWESYTDGQGNPVNSRSRHIAIPEQTLAGLNYPVRNAGGEVAMTNHRIVVKDVDGQERKYVISQCHPNETTGLLVCLLGRANF